MAATGEPYTVAARALAGTRQPGATATLDRALLAPYPDEEGVTVDELGWRALPTDATPGQRARAEAIWRPVSADRPCRCSGSCHHGEACDEEYADGRCSGRTVHVDRYPGSLWGLTDWYDEYVCRSCGDGWEGSVSLPDVPWGERKPEGGTTLIYPGVRHPSFREVNDEYDYVDADAGCPECSGGIDGRCICDTDDGCPECGAGGPNTSPYAECLCEDE